MLEFRDTTFKAKKIVILNGKAVGKIEYMHKTWMIRSVYGSDFISKLFGVLTLKTSPINGHKSTRAFGTLKQAKKAITDKFEQEQIK